MKYAALPKAIRIAVFSPDGRCVAAAWEQNGVGLFRVRLPKKLEFQAKFAVAKTFPKKTLAKN
ncbi:MAG: hypothetical protein N3B10_08630 [Armatimonadetes bacterium]|nr:hypothetical protein [Armatimonadota bacterium]MCX7968539.1 hypothetical protein [Armatimonadota bacterium]MDW8142170.1 hypothetical protein [Armatimonadota bacterium]